MRGLAQIIRDNEEHTRRQLEALAKKTDVTSRIADMVVPDSVLEEDAAEAARHAEQNK